MVVFTIPKKSSKRIPKTIRQAKRLRRNQTKSEKMLWNKLRAKRLYGFKFRRQVAIGNYIVDFYCAEKKLIVEVDGSVHKLKWKEDYVRERKLEYMEYKVIRFTNNEVLKHIDNVLSKILYYLRNDKELETKQDTTYIPSPLREEG